MTAPSRCQSHSSHRSIGPEPPVGPGGQELVWTSFRGEEHPAASDACVHTLSHSGERCMSLALAWSLFCRLEDWSCRAVDDGLPHAQTRLLPSRLRCRQRQSPLSKMAVQFRQPDGSESPLLPPELSLLISDTLESPATFLVVQHLALALKARRPCVLVGLAQSFEYYTAVLRKQVRLPETQCCRCCSTWAEVKWSSIPAERSASE